MSLVRPGIQFLIGVNLYYMMPSLREVVKLYYAKCKQNGDSKDCPSLYNNTRAYQKAG